jgi:uncharacterized protein YkwD
VRHDGRLERAAQYHSRYMRNHTCFRHQCRGERDTEGRLRKFNYIQSGLKRWKFGENLAWGKRGDGTPRDAVRSWMRSPGHRRTLLDTSLREVGIGFTHGTPHSKTAPGGLYTADFGMRRG